MCALVRLCEQYGSERDQRELDNDLVQIMTERFHNILDHSQNSQNDDNTDFTNRLSATELSA